MTDKPVPPASLPDYLADGVPKQDEATLKELRTWIDDLLEYRQGIDVEEIASGEDEEIREIEQTSRGARVVKKVPCGKESCTTCPHGPYAYRVSRKGGEVVWDYQGPVDS